MFWNNTTNKDLKAESRFENVYFNNQLLNAKRENAEYRIIITHLNNALRKKNYGINKLKEKIKFQEELLQEYQKLHMIKGTNNGE